MEVAGDTGPGGASGAGSSSARGRPSAGNRFEGECRRHGRTEFIRRSDGGSPRCLRCRSEQVSKWRRRLKALLVAEAGGACALCGYSRSLSALQFHHIDRTEKRFSLSQEGVTRSLARARTEAAKCALLCANCHAEVEAGVATLPASMGRSSTQANPG